MPEDINGATAQNADAQATAEAQINDALDAALAQTDDAQGQGANYLTREEAEAQINQILNQVQGRAQNYYGNQVKQTRDELLNKTQSEVNSLINDLVQVLDPEQREALVALRDRRKAQETQQELQETLEYVNQLRSGQVQPGAPAQMAMSQDELGLLREEATDLIEGAGVSVQPNDNRLWAGWSPSMSYTQSVALMRKNLRGLKGQGKKPAPAAPRPQDQVPPPVDSAQLTPAGDYGSLGELARAFRDKQIDIDRYREVAAQKGWLR